MSGVYLWWFLGFSSAFVLMGNVALHYRREAQRWHALYEGEVALYEGEVASSDRLSATLKRVLTERHNERKEAK